MAAAVEPCQRAATRKQRLPLLLLLLPTLSTKGVDGAALQKGADGKRVLAAG